MKTTLLICVLLAIAAGFTQAGTDPDTVLAMSWGQVFVYGNGCFDGKYVQLIVSDLKLVARTPTGDFDLQALPDPDTPGPEVSAEVRNRFAFTQELNRLIRKLQQNPTRMSAAIDSLCAVSGVLDRVIPAEDPNTYLIYWKGEKSCEVLILGPDGPDKARATRESIRKGLIVMAKSISRTLNDDALVFIVSAQKQILPPELVVFRDERKKIDALLDVISILQGRTENLRVLKGRVVDELKAPKK